MTTAEVVSTIGVTVLLLSYWLERSGRLQVGPTVHALNTVGATTAAVGSALIPFVPFVVLEACWSLLSLRQLIGSVPNVFARRPFR